ncbi:hypothetical protein P9G84_10180 [Brevibacillus centrosporus]|uniref:hypothetical protein n=1 Tax=Brevibacillus centrosporus TaxID=54910 RepID=UPI0011435B3E|nr:hypothetical protein [Brevibacillus centrosporus]MEC2129335.1 hypothetical protein [Brevibacillus centrosporus]GED33502.1 hypothetical protein BCE02nite_46430 [Brevibacillus centrosporus]
MEVIYRFRRSGAVEEMKIANLRRAMSLAALNFTESIEPLEIVCGEISYSTQEIKQYIKEQNVI